MEPGEYAMRGGIIDIFPAGEADPVRLDLFGDTIESIRVFDPGTQRSADRRQRLIAASGVRGAARPGARSPASAPAGARCSASRRPTTRSTCRSRDGRRHPGMEHWVPLFHERMETLLDYLPGASVSLDHQADEVLAARLEMIADHYAARRMVPRDGEVPYRPLPPGPAVSRPGRLGRDAGRRPAVRASRPSPSRTARSASMAAAARAGVLPRPAAAGHQRVRPACAARPSAGASEGRRIVVAAWTRGSRERLANLLREHGFKDAAPGGRLGGDPPQAGRARCRWSRWAWSAASSPIAARRWCGEQDLLGERISRPPRRRKRADQFIAEATEIAEGDLVVHQEYGIGRYDGLETLDGHRRAA